MNFYPVQVGPPSDFARSRAWHLLGILFLQLLLSICAVVEFLNWPTGVVMWLGLLVGWLAWKEHMNITFVCWYGTVCLFAAFLGVITAFIGISILISTIIVKALVPLSSLGGFMIAWWLFEDYEREHGAQDVLGRVLFKVGIIKQESSLIASVGAGDVSYGITGDTLKKAAAVSLAKDPFHALGDDEASGVPSTEQAKAAANQQFSGARARLADLQGQAAALFQGSGTEGSAPKDRATVDVTADPFATT